MIHDPCKARGKGDAGIDLNASAHGKIALAFGTRDELAYLLDDDLRPHTSSTIIDKAKLRLEIEKVREQGWAGAPSETISGSMPLSCPSWPTASMKAQSVSLPTSTGFLSNRGKKT